MCPRKSSLVVLCLLASACSTTPPLSEIPPRVRIPEPPVLLLLPVGELKTLPGDPDTEVNPQAAILTVTENYGICRDWQSLLEGWQQYYYNIIKPLNDEFDK